MSPEEDAARDAWLQEALRHAPDAALGPPPSLSDAILREARSATAAANAATAPAAGSSEDRVEPRAAPKARGGWLGAAWAWLGRPPVAAGFASLLAATLVGMLWWDRPLDDAMPHAPERVAKPPAPQPEQQPESPTAPPPAAPSAKKDSPDAATSASRPPAPVVAPQARDNVAAAKKAVPAPRAPDESAQSKAETAAKERAEAPASERRDARKPEPFPAAAESPAGDRLAAANTAKTPRAEPGSEPKAAAESSAQDTRGADRLEPMRRQAAAPSGTQGAGAEPSAAPAAPAGRLRGVAKVAAAPLATLRSAVAAEPQRWTWQLDDQPARPINPALQRWLEHADAAFVDGRPDAALAQAPRRTTPAPPQGEAGAGGTADADLTVRLLREGRDHTTLRIGRDDLQIDGAETGPRRSGIPAARAAALKAELAAAAR